MVRFLLLTLFVPQLSLGQLTTRMRLVQFDYSKADSIAVNYPKGKYSDPKELTAELIKDLDTEHEKFRVLFRWIAENIEYRLGRNGTDPEEILRKEKAVCEGYASLLDAMCYAAGIQTRTITGFAKSYPEFDIPLNISKSNHAWTAVLLAGEWHLADVTWAAGTYNPRRRKFKQNFNEDYFLPDPDFFILSHYPDNLRWTLTNNIPKFKDFSKFPIFFPHYRELGCQPYKKLRGKAGHKFKCRFSAQYPIASASLLFEKRSDEFRECKIIKKVDHYKVSYKFTHDDRGVFYLLLDGDAVMDFVHW